MEEKLQRVDLRDRKNALQQLRAVQQDLESQYVLVEKSSSPLKHRKGYAQIPRQSNVSIEAAEGWQKQLLQDPKVSQPRPPLPANELTIIESSRIISTLE